MLIVDKKVGIPTTYEATNHLCSRSTDENTNMKSSLVVSVYMEKLSWAAEASQISLKLYGKVSQIYPNMLPEEQPSDSV